MINYFVKLEIAHSNSIMVCADTYSLQDDKIDVMFYNNRNEVICFIDKRDIITIYHYDNYGDRVIDYITGDR